MKIVVIGANGFLGKNLVQHLLYKEAYEVFEITRETSETEVMGYLKEADFIFHLAGVNRPEDENEFIKGNRDLIEEIVEKLEQIKNYPPILLTSSVQAELDNPYGKSKRAGEAIVLNYSKKFHTPCFIYRLPNVFGKWAQPNYNSVVATFSYKIAREEDIQIQDADKEVAFVYIDDVIKEFLRVLDGRVARNLDFYTIPIVYEVKIGELAELLQLFNEARKKQIVPDMSDSFIKKLYSTYLSYLPSTAFRSVLTTHEDPRGSFTEFVKSPAGGQVSVNVSKPGVTKGEHWHHTKNEKFLVVRGAGKIKLRHIFKEEVLEYQVSDKKLEIIDIPVGYTHSIVNTGSEEMVTIMWVNEMFDPQNPDTYALEV